MKHFLIFIFIFISCSFLSAQQTLSYVYLKGGKMIEGEILDYQQGVSLSIKSQSGLVREIAASEVERIAQLQIQPEVEGNSNPAMSNTEKVTFEREVYNVFYFSSLNGQENDDYSLGVGLHNVTGYQFTPLLGLGLGFGIDTYSFDEGERVYPLFAELRGYLKPAKTTPYYSLSTGYGFVHKTGDRLIEAEGGWMGRASIGLMLGRRADSNVVVDLGYQLQNAYYLRELVNGELEEKTVTFNRIVIRVGLIF